MSPTYRISSALALLAILAAAWLLWSGIYKPLLLGLGTFSCVLSVYVAYRVGFFRGTTGLHVIPKLPGYWLWLIGEIARSSVEVMRIVLNPKLPISPTVVEFDAAPKGLIGQVTLGNAITLSPGTITLDVFENRLRVHCLTKEGAASLESGEANRRTAALTEQ